MDFAAFEGSVALALACAATVVGVVSLARTLSGAPAHDAGDKRLRRTDLVWTAVPVLLLFSLLLGVIYRLPNG
jgi:hypothetical protein